MGSTATTSDPVRVPMLDLLRMAAVLGVILFHYGFRGPTASGITAVALPELSSFARYGYLGVPAFFIISGFVIAYSAEGRTALGFAIARFTRIYPTFLFCMTLTFLAVLAFGAPHFHTGTTQWFANLFIAAPALGQPYMDSAYWSLIDEGIFYAWVALFIALGRFPRQIDSIVLVWLVASLLNGITIDAPLICKLFLGDTSGFFATGLLIYEFYKGRRDARLTALMAAAVGTAVFQAAHNLEPLKEVSGAEFNTYIVAAIVIISVLIIMIATRIRSLPLPSSVVLAVGGITYPLYLLHQQIGYTVLHWIDPANPVAAVLLILASIVALSWATWRFYERLAQRQTRQWLTIALTPAAPTPRCADV